MQSQEREQFQALNLRDLEVIGQIKHRFKVFVLILGTSIIGYRVSSYTDTYCELDTFLVIIRPQYTKKKKAKWI